jgi:hypothetical protein
MDVNPQTMGDSVGIRFRTAAAVTDVGRPAGEAGRMHVAPLRRGRT